MNIYMTEQEQIESIKKWWHAHGWQVLTLALVIMLAFAGSQIWQKHQAKTHILASNYYEALMVSVAQGDDEALSGQAREIILNFPSSVYAASSALVYAKVLAYQEKWALASQKLQWVIDNAQNSQFRQVARIRLAKIKAYLKQYTAALSVLATVEDPAYLPLIYETRGDLYAEQAKISLAQKQYIQALAFYPKLGMRSPFLEMKLHDLTVSDLNPSLLSQQAKL